MRSAAVSAICATTKDTRDGVNQPVGIAASAFFHDFGGVAARAKPCWNESGHDGRQQSDADREREHRPIDFELDPIRQRKRQPVCRLDKHVHGPIGNHDTGDCAERRHNQTFGQHLTHDSPMSGAERAANRHFFRPQRDPPELHVHHVHARDEQNENDRGQHSPSLLAQLHACQCVQKRPHTG